ncbi:hypothetical protein CLOSTASPAR_02188 [[Clostridium] asparagiforme DSM 15981]|uniref:Uncharacterized protein n=1 Tax=[Clostridium] asparagiforme DSM 15981 TaxID=518636 RepID=C0CYW1_9FIRM|nr:hypothetical protein CLOSTASPAR_02188 [[Clostridium] asparagiforme DSM 15981]
MAAAAQPAGAGISKNGHKKSSRWVGPEGERLSLSIKRWN